MSKQRTATTEPAVNHGSAHHRQGGESFPWLLSAAAVALGLLCYALALDGTLLFDTKAVVTQNLLVRVDAGVFDDWRSALLSFEGSEFGRPLSQLSFALNYALAGDFSVVQLRLTNVLIHLAVAVCLFAFLRNLLQGAPVFAWPARRARDVAALAALIWFLHPLHVSTVFYVVQRMAQFSTLFILLGLYIYTHYRNRWCLQAPSPGEFIAGALWLLLVLVVGVLFKENAALLLWLIPVVEVCAYRGGWGRREHRGLAWLAQAALVAPVLVVAVLVATDGFLWLGSYEGREFNLLERSLTQLRVLWHYVAWTLLPNAQVLSLHHDDIALSVSLLQPLTTLWAALAWLASGCAAFLLRHRAPLVLLVWLFFLVGHSMESSILPLEMVWEHRNYLPSMAICLAIAAAFDALRSRFSPALGNVVLAAVFLMLLVNLFLRTDRWSDELLLARINVENHPESLRSNYHYANTLYRRFVDGDDVSTDYLVASRHHYERMHQLDPEDVSALISLYFFDQRYFPQLAAQVDWFELLEEAVRVRTLSASDFNALELLVTCLADDSCKMAPERVEGLFQTLFERYAGKPRLWVVYGRYQLDALAADAQAVAAFEQALALDPGYLNAYLMLIQVYDRRGEAGAVYLRLAELLAADEDRRALGRLRVMLNPELAQ